MSDTEDTTCPLCMEEMDLVDKNFVPCPCGYRVCMWCWHHIKENMNGLCPACRVPYKEDPHAFVEVDRTEVVKKNKEKKQKERLDKKSDKPPANKVQAIDRKHLHNYRVVQRNLVYIIGVPSSIATEETLRRPEYFGQYGRISKVVVHRNHSSSHTTVSAYITFAFKDDARAAIQALEGFWLDGHQMRASFGTTKYCNNFIRGVPCSNPECVYLHELGDDEDRFTKEEIQAGYSKLMQQPGKDQILVTGAGGPSGTGKRTSNELVLPPPVFVQDLSVAEKKKQISSTAAMEHRNQISKEEGKGVVASNSTSSLSSMDSKNSNFGKSTGKPINYIILRSDPFLDQAQNVPMNGSVGGVKAQLSGATTSNSVSNSASRKVSADNKQGSGSPVSFSSSFSSLVSPSSFNGLGNCAVFPVPVSSLSVSIWRNIVQSGSGEDLKINPYALIKVPLTELFELTIPPVDATCVSSWPRPLSHYSQGAGPNGVTHAPVGQHKHQNTSSSSEPQHAAHHQLQHEMSPEQLQQYHQQKAYQQQQQQLQQRANQQQYSHHQYVPQQQQQPNMAALQQIFPGVNMSYGGQPGGGNQGQR